MNKKYNFAQKLENIAKSLRDSYFALPRIHHIDSRFMPSRDEIYLLIDRLFALIYPGFFGRQDLMGENIDQHLRNELDDISNLLYRQVFQCFSCRNQQDADEIEQLSQQVTEQFLSDMPQLREILASDVLAAFKGDPAAKHTDEVVFSYPATIAITCYRLAHSLWRLQVPYIPRIINEFAHSRTGIDIHPGARISKGFFIDHGTGVVIGETTIIGENCKLYQGVTLGAPSFPHNQTGQIKRNYKRHPTLEDEVIVYANATILGDVLIGKGATIGGNVFITRSVPPGCTVSMKPFELKYRNRPISLERGYVENYQI